jgi:hypothetical protein
MDDMKQHAASVLVHRCRWCASSWPGVLRQFYPRDQPRGSRSFSSPFLSRHLCLVVRSLCSHKSKSTETIELYAVVLERVTTWPRTMCGRARSHRAVSSPSISRTTPVDCLPIVTLSSHGRPPSRRPPPQRCHSRSGLISSDTFDTALVSCIHRIHPLHSSSSALWCAVHSF